MLYTIPFNFFLDSANFPFFLNSKWLSIWYKFFSCNLNLPTLYKCFSFSALFPNEHLIARLVVCHHQIWIGRTVSEVSAWPSRYASLSIWPGIRHGCTGCWWWDNICSTDQHCSVILIAHLPEIRMKSSINISGYSQSIKWYGKLLINFFDVRISLSSHAWKLGNFINPESQSEEKKRKPCRFVFVCFGFYTFRERPVTTKSRAINHRLWCAATYSCICSNNVGRQMMNRLAKIFFTTSHQFSLSGKPLRFWQRCWVNWRSRVFSINY
jgi:hypothetical protein